MCDSLDNLDNIKRSIKNDEKAIKLAKHIKLVSELGEPAENFRIIDRKEITYDDIQEYNLAIKTGVPGIRPKKSQIVSRPTFGDKYEIRYNYDLREELSGPKLLDTSRDFCVHIIDANKMYLRQDIDKMSNGFELSVFEYSGGFWNNDGVIEPKCRHSWFLNFVERLK
jgi:hypothetical protein